LKFCRKSLCRPPFFLFSFFFGVTIREWWKSYYNNFCKKSVVSYFGHLLFTIYYFIFIFLAPPEFVCLFVLARFELWT
jgi:hypothetical protein